MWDRRATDDDDVWGVVGGKRGGYEPKGIII
jgi:hypothetical protein